MSIYLRPKARLGHLTRTAAATSAQLGPDAPQTLRAQAAVTSTRLTAARLDLLRHQAPTAAGPSTAASTTPPSPPSPAAPSSSPTPPNPFQQKYGFTYTDDSGCFLLNPAATTEDTTPLFLQLTDPAGAPI